MGVSGLQEIRIDGKVPGATGYPFYQTFSFVTNSSPNGQVKSFIDFALSDKGREIIEKKGMVPVSQ
jgi:ABC-type phosphate transport system substrate-binding protein